MTSMGWCGESFRLDVRNDVFRHGNWIVVSLDPHAKGRLTLVGRVA